MKKITKYIAVGLLIISSSCKKGFLDRYPQDTISPELFFQSETDLSLYINGLLDLPGTWQYLGDQSSDNTATTGSIEIKNMMIGTPTSQTITGGWDWGRLRNINYFLDNYNKAAVTQEVKDHYAGLARYYRAAFYFAKISRFSDVPWYGKTLLPEDPALYKGRDPRALVVDSMMADLSFAASHVREKVPVGTPNIWAVKMLFARIALYEGTYRKYHPELNLQPTAERFLDSALTQTRDIMASAKFAIYTDQGASKSYAALFASQDASKIKEIILANSSDYAKSNGSSNSNINSYVFGDYEQSPSRDLIQTYLMQDGTRFTDIPGYDKFQFTQEFVNRDPRMVQTLAYPGFKRANDTRPYIQRLNKNFTGYHQVKGYFNTTDNVVAGSMFFPVYRYAETLLIYAEALAEKEKLTQSDLDKSINLLRARAGMPPIDMVTSNANIDPVLASQYPDVNSSLKGTILEIRRERRVELALEGYRYDDLMRWHAGKLLQKIPEGMYFPGLGKYDMTGDGIPDIILIDKSQDIPAEGNKEKNSLNITLDYYKAGSFGDDVTVYLKNGAAGGNIVTETNTRNFQEPKFYYRPVPNTQVVLNPNLKQIFGWE
ncbi:SusD-like starch-binding protein associating with outer membrane [Chitinophaga dinghuensis]|uniref:SusD-like starch-binding protein associating with outer membrane n=1 Tax=Chitinophaga dinghuensis TaxID=1539050 RepID=A0A327WBN7_9BACT|nr:RagB/SusD family nutrient uptake outer membrane protein [Chitinophaga dinghuensis]RAJ87588.1 SusD-like starch-binding protein associating with outer membrane [Chitinophaga dinghuensis]